jgi:capsular polysaccharide biosynthesis protein
MPLSPPESSCDTANASGVDIQTLEALPQPALPILPDLPPPLAQLLAHRRPCVEPYQLVTLPGGRVYSHHGAVIDANNCLVGPLSREIRGPVRARHTPHRLLSRKSALPDPIDLPGKTLVLASASSWKNYFHWMIDALPRLRGISASDFDHVFTPCRHAFQRETLALAGIRKEQLVTAREDSHIRAEELVVPSFPPPGTVTSAGLRFLRKLIPTEASTIPATTGTRVFLSREDTWNRGIANAAELHAALVARDFHILQCSTLRVAQQADWIRSASIVVAPHGAALTNLAFCNPATPVIECFASDYIRAHFHDIAGRLDLSYQAHWTPGGDPAAQQWALNIPEILDRVDRCLGSGN